MVNSVEYYPPIDHSRCTWDEARINIIGQNGNDGLHYVATNVFDTHTTITRGILNMSDGATEMMKEEAALSYQAKVKAFTQETTTKAVIRDLLEREQMGIKKYGHTVNESKDDMIQHLYEELLDASCYIKTLLNQRKEGKM